MDNIIILRFEFKEREESFKIPENAKILCAKYRLGRLSLWAECKEKSETDNLRTFVVLHTGQKTNVSFFKHFQYVDTVVDEDSGDVWVGHVYEIKYK